MDNDDVQVSDNVAASWLKNRLGMSLSVPQLQSVCFEISCCLLTRQKLLVCTQFWSRVASLWRSTSVEKVQTLEQLLWKCVTCFFFSTSSTILRVKK